MHVPQGMAWGQLISHGRTSIEKQGRIRRRTHNKEEKNRFRATKIRQKKRKREQSPSMEATGKHNWESVCALEACLCVCCGGLNTCRFSLVYRCWVASRRWWRRWPRQPLRKRKRRRVLGFNRSACAGPSSQTRRKENRFFFVVAIAPVLAGDDDMHAHRTRSGRLSDAGRLRPTRRSRS